MTTLYTIELKHPEFRQLWAFMSNRGASLVTSYESRAGLFADDAVRSWVEASPLIKRGWRAKIRVATADQLRRNSPEAAA